MGGQTGAKVPPGDDLGEWGWGGACRDKLGIGGGAWQRKGVPVGVGGTKCPMRSPVNPSIAPIYP